VVEKVTFFCMYCMKLDTALGAAILDCLHYDLLMKYFILETLLICKVN